MPFGTTVKVLEPHNHYDGGELCDAYYCYEHCVFACRKCYNNQKCECLVAILKPRHYCPDCKTEYDCPTLSGCALPRTTVMTCDACFKEKYLDTINKV